jgi:hypothetical protein
MPPCNPGGNNQNTSRNDKDIIEQPGKVKRSDHDTLSSVTQPVVYLRLRYLTTTAMIPCAATASAVHAKVQ